MVGRREGRQQGWEAGRCRGLGVGGTHEGGPGAGRAVPGAGLRTRVGRVPPAAPPARCRSPQGAEQSPARSPAGHAEDGQGAPAAAALQVGRTGGWPCHRGGGSR